MLTTEKNIAARPMVTGLDFADDLVLVSDTAWQAQELLEPVKNAGLRVGVHECRENKVHGVQHVQLTVWCKNENIRGNYLDVVEDFKYLGSWTQSSLQDTSPRKALAWRACNKDLEIKSK